jgi:hypothetical protein
MEFATVLVADGVEVRAELGVIAQKNESNAPVEAVTVGFVDAVHKAFPQAYLPHVLDASAPLVTTAILPALK